MTDIFLGQGQANPNDVKLTDPTTGPTNNYVLIAAVVAFVLTGIAAQPLEGRTLSASVTTYTETGNAASSLLVGHRLSPSVTAFVETGQAAALAAGRRLAPPQTAFVETGIAATLAAGRQLAPAVGAFTETGSAATLTSGRRFAPSATAFTETGIAAILAEGRGLAPTVTAFALTGDAADQSVAHRLAPTSTAFVETGVAARLETRHALQPTVTAFALTGAAATLTRQSVLAVVAGAFVGTGLDATLTVQTGHATLVAEPGIYGLIGSAATLTYAGQQEDRPAQGPLLPRFAPRRYVAHYELAASCRIFRLIGRPASLRRGSRLSAQSAQIAAGGRSVGSYRTYRIMAVVGPVLAQETAAGLARGRALTGRSASFCAPAGAIRGRREEADD